MDYQIDGPAAASAQVPVDELGAGDGENSRRSVPLVPVVAVELGAAQGQHPFQGNGPESQGPTPAAAGRSWFGIGLGVEFGPQALAAFHVDDVAVFSEPIYEGGRQVVVLKKGPP